jgi:hypothetical protein
MDFKKTNAEPSTVTRDIRRFDGPTGNIYESISIISKRANQISSEIKEELSSKSCKRTTNKNLILFVLILKKTHPPFWQMGFYLYDIKK